MTLPVYPALPAEAELLRSVMAGHAPDARLLANLQGRHLLVEAGGVSEVPDAMPPARWLESGELLWLMEEGHLLGTLHLPEGQPPEPLRSLLRAVLLAGRREGGAAQVQGALANLPVPLLLLGEGGAVLASSRGLMALLGHSEQLEPGGHFPPPGLAVPPALGELVEAAWSGREASARLTLGGHTLQVQARMWLDPGPRGVLLLFEDAAPDAQLRRELQRQSDLLTLALQRSEAHLLLVGPDDSLLAHSQPMHSGIVRSGYRGSLWQAGPFLERNAEPLSQAIARLRAGEAVEPLLLPWPRPGGAQHLLEATLQAHGDLLRLSLCDHTERQRQRAALGRVQGTLEALLEHMPSAALLLGEDGELTHASAAAQALLAPLQPGHDWARGLRLTDAQGREQQPWKAALAGQAVPWRELHWDSRHGQRVLNVSAAPTPGGAVLVLHDLTGARRAEVRAQHHSTHDRLTGLPNRRALQAALEGALAEPRDSAWLLLIAADQHELIGEALGGDAADRALMELAARTRRAFGDALVARGDDHTVAVLLTRPGHDLDAGAAQLQREMERPLRLGGERLHATVSLGAARLEAGGDPDDLLRRAFSALRGAQRRGGGLLRYRSGLDEDAQSALSAENTLREALSGGALTLGYQPVFELHSGAVRRFEALLRWRDAGDRPSPGSLLGQVRGAGLFDELGEWIVDELSRQAAGWARPLPLSVNLNHPALLQGRALRAGLAALGRGVPLHFEMPEALLLSHTERAGELIARVQAAGGGVGVDDFSLRSAFSTLVGHRLNTVKLHRSLIAALHEAPTRPLVSALLQLARQHGAEVVAQGIERPEQLQALRALGCALGQGFLSGAPLSAEGVSALLSGGEPRIELP